MSYWISLEKNIVCTHVTLCQTSLDVYINSQLFSLNHENITFRQKLIWCSYKYEHKTINIKLNINACKSGENILRTCIVIYLLTGH